MEQYDHFYGYFNIALGIAMILIGFKIYRPFKNEETFNKLKNLYRFGGIALAIYGLIRIL
jgi:hypothetical protein